MNKRIVARLNIQYKNGTREAVEIHRDSTFSAFYFLYAYQGPRKKSPLMIPTRSRTFHNRIEECRGLDGVLTEIQGSFRCKTNPVAIAVVKVYQKRLYKRMLNASPDDLGVPAYRPSNEHQQEAVERRQARFSRPQRIDLGTLMPVMED